MSTYLKPQTPLYSKKNKAYIYPPTTSDQVIMPDGSRLTPDKLEAMILDTATPDAIGALSMELLWENASPTSEFAAQTIELDLKKDSFVLIGSIPSMYRSDYHSIFWSLIPVGKEGAITAEYCKNRYRKVKVTVSGCEFSTAYDYATYGEETNTNSSQIVIPQYIYSL